MIDSRDPGPVLHGVLSLELLKLEGGSGGGVGTALLSLQLWLTGGLHRPPSANGRLLAAGSTTLGLECQSGEGDWKTLDQ